MNATEAYGTPGWHNAERRRVVGRRYVRRLAWLGLWLWLGAASAAGMLVMGCGTESATSAQSAAPTPADLGTPTPVMEQPCLPPRTPAPGHEVRGHTYRVCSSPGWTQEVHMWWDTGPDGPDWPPPPVPCVDPATITPIPDCSACGFAAEPPDNGREPVGFTLNVDTVEAH